MADVKKTTKATKATKVAQEVKTLDQLRDELANLRDQYQESRRSHRLGELVNPHVLTSQRKAIARSLTVIRHTELAAKKEEN